MTSARLPGLIVFVAACLLGAPLQVGATAIASSTLDFNHLAITPAAGTFSLDGVWSLEAFAHADNSLGEIDEQFTPGNSPGMVSASAAVTWASANGAARAPNAPPDLVVAGSASSTVKIPGYGPASASGNGRGTLFNSFTLTGGGPSVSVTFEIDIWGLIDLLTDSFGVFARSETIFTLAVDGEVVLFDDRPREIGPNSGLIEPFAERLMNTVTLASVDADGMPLSHSLILEADSESRALVIPEPPIALLVVAGLGALAAARRRTVRVVAE